MVNPWTEDLLTMKKSGKIFSGILRAIIKKEIQKSVLYPFKNFTAIILKVHNLHVYFNEIYTFRLKN